jgi:hypothetical protein
VRWKTPQGVEHQHNVIALYLGVGTGMYAQQTPSYPKVHWILEHNLPQGETNKARIEK